MGFRPRILGWSSPIQVDFRLLLAALIGFYLVVPVCAEVMIHRTWLLQLLFGVLVLVASLATGSRRAVLVTSLLLGGTALLLGGALLVFEITPSLRIAQLAATILFLGFTAFVVLRAVLRESGGTAQSIFAALCVYFLIGLVWSSGYQLVECVQPGSFDRSGQTEMWGTLEAAAVERGADFYRVRTLIEWVVFTYFSLVTLTTVGYGDITPVRPFAMTLASVEGFMGQIYIAVLVAWLVGVRVSASVTGRSAFRGEK